MDVSGRGVTVEMPDPTIKRSPAPAAGSCLFHFAVLSPSFSETVETSPDRCHHRSLARWATPISTALQILLLIFFFLILEQHNGQRTNAKVVDAVDIPTKVLSTRSL